MLKSISTQQTDPAKPLVYLACPYSHDDPDVRLARFNAANRAAGWLLNRNWIVFSPISHTHPITEACDLPADWEFWQGFDRAYLSVSQRLFVLQLNGWDESTGVTAEIEIARLENIPIVYIEQTFKTDRCENIENIGDV